MAQSRRPYLLALAAFFCLAALLGLWIESNGNSGSAPTAVTGSATLAGAGSETRALLTAMVDPGGLGTTYQFEYVAAAEYEPAAKQPYVSGDMAPVSPAAIESGREGRSVPVKVALSGFEPNTTYHYRVVARNPRGTSRGRDRTFVTPPACRGAAGKCAWSKAPLGGGSEKTESLADVSCPSPSLCFAVGSHRGAKKGIAEFWSGSRREVIGKSDQELEGVSCPPAEWCMAVGNRTAITWNLESGKPSPGAGKWRVEANPPPFPKGANELTIHDVSCNSKTACTAVGIYWKSGYKTYVAHWKGRDWKFESAVNQPWGVTHGMLDVSCPTTNFCVAAGSYVFKPLIEHWDGRKWTIASTPYPTGSTEANIKGVSCTSPSSCIAVGDFKGSSEIRKPLALYWNGSDWSMAGTPALSKVRYGELSSVSCLSAVACVAVGSVADYPKGETTLAEAWDGTNWRLQSTLSPSGFDFLMGVSCTSVVACAAVGQTAETGSALVERLG